MDNTRKIVLPIYQIANNCEDKTILSVGIERKLRNDISNLIYASILDNPRYENEGFIRVYYKRVGQKVQHYMAYELGIVSSIEPIEIISYNTGYTVIEIEGLKYIEVAFAEKQLGEICDKLIHEVMGEDFAR